MTNPDYRAMCAELINELSGYKVANPMHDRSLLNRARAALAEADGPAVPEGREPASVATQPNDEELLNIAAQTIEIYGSELCAFARAVLARWGRPAATPVPNFGEVAAALKVIDKMQQEWVLLGNDDDGTASPSLSMPISLRRFTVLRDALFRAATLLQQQAAPVRVSERLPGAEDCDAEGRCWLGGHLLANGAPTWLLGYPAWDARFQDVHYFWLPANALPLPAPEGGEVI